MASTFNNPQTYGVFLPTTSVWDVGELYAAEGLEPQVREILVRLYQNLNQMALAVNYKDTGYYYTDIFVNGQIWFPNPATPTTSFSSSTAQFRPNFRQVVYFGLPNAGVITIPHNINVTAQTSFTRIYGAASNQTALTSIPLPYVNLVAANQVQVDVDATNVTITTGIDYSAYTVAYIVVEYLQT